MGLLKQQEEDLCILVGRIRGCLSIAGLVGNLRPSFIAPKIILALKLRVSELLEILDKQDWPLRIRDVNSGIILRVFYISLSCFHS